MKTITRAAGAISTAGLLSGLLGRIVRAARSYLTKSRAQAQLEALDDRLLLDIGLKRSEIHHMVWGCSR